MIIDCNAHITETGKWFNTTIPSDVNELLLKMDEAKVDKSLLVPFYGFVSNKFVLQAARTNPDRLLAACSVNPKLQTNKELVNELKQMNGEGVRICKLHNRLHNYDPACKEVYSFLEINAKLPKPMVIFFCGVLYSKNIQITLTPTSFFHQITSAFPNTIFVIMHSATTHALQVAEAVKDNPNVYLDLSFVISKYKGSSIGMDLTYLIKNFDRRLLWGSDFPEFTPLQALQDFDKLSDGITEEKKENILSKNVLSLLK